MTTTLKPPSAVVRYCRCFVLSLVLAVAAWNFHATRDNDPSISRGAPTSLALQPPTSKPDLHIKAMNGGPILDNDASVKEHPRVKSIIWKPMPQITASRGSGNIPRRLIFIYSTNLLRTKTPKVLFDNVKNTIKAYQRAWKNLKTERNKDVEVKVDMYTDETCRAILEKTAPSLVEHFENEEKGSYKADICRIAVLYLTGGYYFDVDMKVIEPYLVEAPSKNGQSATHVQPTFITAMDAGRDGYFQSFMATAPRHPILKQALVEMENYYNNVNGVQDEIFDQNLKFGPMTLKMAHDAVIKQYQTTAVQSHRSSQSSSDATGLLLLQEDFLDSEEKQLFPSLQRQDGNGCCCNVVVHNQNRPFFFSRIPGAGEYCEVPTETIR